jgi:hypothetical protein
LAPGQQGGVGAGLDDVAVVEDGDLVGVAPPRWRNTNAEQNAIWSGGVMCPPAGNTVKSVLEQWIVPDLDAPTATDRGDFCQSGVTRTGTAITRNVWAWYLWCSAT